MNSSFQVTAGKGNEATAIIIKGVAASDVKVDGKNLTRLSERPDASSEAGFYNDDDTETVIQIGNNDWSDVTIKLGKYNLPNLMKNAKVSDEDLKSAVDGDFDSSYLFGSKAETEDSVTFTMKRKHELKDLVVKWTENYAETFTVEVSTNGKKWTTIAEETEGYGGINEYSLDGMKVKYVRISNVSGPRGVMPRIYEVEAYGKAQILSLASVWWLILLGVVLVAVITITVLVLRKKGIGGRRCEKR